MWVAFWDRSDSLPGCRRPRRACLGRSCVPQRFLRSKPQWSPTPSSAPPRLAFVTATSGDLGSLEQQRRFLRDVASGVPHVVVDDLARARSIASLANDPDVQLHELDAADFTTGRAGDMGASVAIAQEREGFIHPDSRSIPLPGFLEAYRDAFAVCGTSRGGCSTAPSPTCRPMMTWRPRNDEESRNSSTRTRAARSRLLVTCARTRTIGCSWRTASPSTCASGGCSVVSAPDYRDPAIGDLDLAMRAEQAGLSMA